MSEPGAHLSFQYQELNRVTDALSTLRGLGVPLDNPAYAALNRARAAALNKLGLIQPRTTTILRVLAGLSPGEIRLFMDAERGWLVEAIKEPGAAPVHKYVSDEVAATIIKGELTHELEDELMTPEPEFIA